LKKKKKKKKKPEKEKIKKIKKRVTKLIAHAVTLYTLAIGNKLSIEPRAQG